MIVYPRIRHTNLTVREIRQRAKQFRMMARTRTQFRYTRQEAIDAVICGAIEHGQG